MSFCLNSQNLSVTLSENWLNMEVMLCDCQGKDEKGHAVSALPSENSYLLIEPWTSMKEVRPSWDLHAGEATCRQLRQQSQQCPCLHWPSPAARHMSEKTILEVASSTPTIQVLPQYPRHQGVLGEDLNGGGTGGPPLVLHTPNSWPTESESTVKRWLFHTLLLGVVLT